MDRKRKRKPEPSVLSLCSVCELKERSRFNIYERTQHRKTDRLTDLGTVKRQYSCRTHVIPYGPNNFFKESPGLCVCVPAGIERGGVRKQVLALKSAVSG